MYANKISIYTFLNKKQERNGINMITKMNLDVIAENEEEKKIKQFLNVLHNSNEIKDFLEKMRQEAEKRKVFRYRERIKQVESAIRTYRINKKKLEEVHDYVGISFITNTEEEIYPIIEYLKKQMPNAEYIDFVDEEYIYSPLVYIKWVPPLGYNVFAKEAIIPNERKVPIEIRVCSKEAFISEQSAYYSVQKNDTITMPIEEKNKLRNIIQHITYKLALLTLRQLTESERNKHLSELNKIINDNKEFLRKNHELCKDAILDFGRLVYKLEHDEEINSNPNEEINNNQKFEILKEKNIINNIDNKEKDIDEILKTYFYNLIVKEREETNKNIIEQICNATNKIIQL